MRAGLMLAGAASAALLGLGACTAVPLADEPPPGPALALPLELAGSTWVQKTLDGAPPVDGKAVSFSFASDGQVTGTTGCNRFFGQWSQAAGVITISGAGMTRMACMGPLGEQENSVTRLFEAGIAAEINAEDRLVLRGPNGPELVLARVPSIG